MSCIIAQLKSNFHTNLHCFNRNYLVWKRIEFEEILSSVFCIKFCVTVINLWMKLFNHKSKCCVGHLYLPYSWHLETIVGLLNTCGVFFNMRNFLWNLKSFTMSRDATYHFVLTAWWCMFGITGVFIGCCCFCPAGCGVKVATVSCVGVAMGTNLMRKMGLSTAVSATSGCTQVLTLATITLFHTQC